MLYDPQCKPEVEVKQLEPWRQLLLDGADYIEAHGWCQGRTYLSTGEVCFAGSLIASLGAVGRRLTSSEEQLYHACTHAMRNTLGMDPVYWNDHRGTEGEVIATMRKVARS